MQDVRLRIVIQQRGGSLAEHPITLGDPRRSWLTRAAGTHSGVNIGSKRVSVSNWCLCPINHSLLLAPTPLPSGPLGEPPASPPLGALAQRGGFLPADVLFPNAKDQGLGQVAEEQGWSGGWRGSRDREGASLSKTRATLMMDSQLRAVSSRPARRLRAAPPRATAAATSRLKLLRRDFFPPYLFFFFPIRLKKMLSCRTIS